MGAVLPAGHVWLGAMHLAAATAIQFLGKWGAGALKALPAELSVPRNSNRGPPQAAKDGGDTHLKQMVITS